MPKCLFCGHINFYKRCSENEAYCTEYNRFFDVDNSQSCAGYVSSFRTQRQCELENEDGINYCNRNGYTYRSSCFVTTAICDILNYPDDCLEMELLRNLRDDYMIGNPEYRSLLLEYYVIGPIISNRLMQDQNKERIAQQLYQNYLKPTVDLLIDEKKGQAIAYYKQMVGQLKEFYHLDHLELDFEQIDRIPKLKNKEDLKQLAKKITIK